MTQGRGFVGAAVAAVCVAATLAACGSSGRTQDNQVFLQATASDDALSAVDVTTREQIGHDMCHLLDKYHGDSGQADQAFSAGSATFTPVLVSHLRSAATLAYCPKWRS